MENIKEILDELCPNYILDIAFKYGFLKQNNKGRPVKIDYLTKIKGWLYFNKCSCPWREIPKIYGSYCSIYRFTQKLAKVNFMEFVMKQFLEDNKDKLDFTYLTIDSTSILNKLGEELVGYGHKFKGKQSTKISIIVESNNIPISVVFSSGNVHDSKLLQPNLDSFLIDKPKPCPIYPQYFLADKAYDSKKIRDDLTESKYCIRIPGKNKRLTKEEIELNKIYKKRVNHS